MADRLRRASRAALIGAVACAVTFASEAPPALVMGAAWVVPATGIALAGALLFGDGVLLGVVAGVLAAGLVRGQGVTAGLYDGFAVALEAWAGAALTRRIPGFRPSLDRLRDVGGLIVGAALLAPGIGATIAVLSPWLATLPPGEGGAPLARVGAAWAARWVADGVGVLVFAPPVLVSARRTRGPLTVGTAGHAALLAALLAACAVVFDRVTGPVRVAMPYLVVPLLLWAVLEFGARGGVLATLFTIAAAWILAAHDPGSPGGLFAAETLGALQLFAAATMSTVLLLGAARAEREDALASLREARDSLEERVRGRTQQLLRVNRELGRQIDERRRAEEDLRERERALRSSEERFRAVAETAKDAILTVDGRGRVCYANRAALTLSGYSRDGLMGRHFSALLPLATRVASQDRIRRQVRGPGWWSPAAPIDVTVRRQNGTETPVEVTLSRWRTPDGARFFTGILRDLTERRREEERLRRSEERFRLLVDGVRDLAIFGIDRQGRVTSWNSGAERLTGWRAEEIVGGHFSRLFGEDDVAGGKPDALLRIASTAGRLEDEGWRRRKDGTLFWANVIVSALYDAAGEVTGFAKVVRDLTERRQSEEALRRAHDGLEAHIRERTRDLSLANAELQRQMAERREVERSLARQARELAHTNAELELFGYVASHDLREPLRTVASYTELLSRRYTGKLGAEADQYIRYAVDAVTWMHRLLDDLLNFSRLGREALKIEPLEGEQLLDSALTNLSLAIRESGAVVTHDPLPRLGGDGPQIVQLLQNLIGNALKFHGPLPPRVHVSARRVGRMWRWSVRDNGIGMDPEHLDRIFIAFQRLHTRAEFSGTGIGLAICKKIVERHRGRIWARSTPGQGSELLFTLPVSAAATLEPGGRAAYAVAGPRGARAASGGAASSPDPTERPEKRRAPPERRGARQPPRPHPVA